MEKGSKDFMYMVKNPQNFNLKWMFVKSTKGMVPFIDENGKSLEEPVPRELAEKVAKLQ